MLKKIIDWILRVRVYLIAFFLIGAGISAVMTNQVTINYDLTQYLPAESDFMESYEVMKQQFGNNEVIRVMYDNVDSQSEAQSLTLEIAAIDGIEDVTLAGFSATDSAALYDLALELELTYDDIRVILTAIRDLDDMKSAYLSGSSVTNIYLQDTSTAESRLNILFFIPILFFVLLLTTKSWFEPVLSLVTMLTAVIISMGTNVFFPQGISYITSNILAALTIAVSMDYSIFLIHAFKEARGKTASPIDAMKSALLKSFTTISVSSLTTIAGFAALLIMQFGIGSDMGMVFSKSIFIAVLTVLLLLPPLLLVTYKWIEKLEHRSFLPSFDKLATFSVNSRFVFLTLSLLLLVPAVYGQFNNTFIYGTSAVTSSEQSQVYQDNTKIQSVFETGNLVYVVFEESGDFDEQWTIYQELLILRIDESFIIKPSSRTFPGLLYQAMTTPIDPTNPNSTIPNYMFSQGIIPNPNVTIQQFYDLLSNPQIKAGLSTRNPSLAVQMQSLLDYEPLFQTNTHARFILELDLPEESAETFQALDDIHASISEHTNGGVYLVGSSASAKGIKEVVDVDYTYVTILGLLAIAFLIFLSFQSFSLPLILLFVIQMGIFVNMAIPFYLGTSLGFIGYLVVSSIQLGCTIDYAILMTHHYLEERQHTDAKSSAKNALKASASSILTSALILSLAGFVIASISSNVMIAQIGTLLGRAGIINVFFNFLLLPGLLVITDKLMKKTTRNVSFYEVK
jgi:uncharacterized protein